MIRDYLVWISLSNYVVKNQIIISSMACGLWKNMQCIPECFIVLFGSTEINAYGHGQLAMARWFDR